MSTLHLNHNGVWKIPNAVYTKYDGGWHSIRSVWENLNGTWIKHWPNPGSASWTVGGTYSFTVPAGITSITVTMYGGGGGGGATNNGYFNAYMGSGGGAGGAHQDASIAVTSSEVLTIVVGQRGYGASYRMGMPPGGYLGWNYTNTGEKVPLGEGTSGGNTSISRGGTGLLTATGGYRGEGLTNGWAGGPGGRPIASGADDDGNGRDGGKTGEENINAEVKGGNNNSGKPPSGHGSVWNPGTGTGYGNGGGQPNLDGLGCNGQDGAVFISWG